MIELTESADGVRLKVKARPAGKRNAILGEHAGALRVAVTAAPEKGKANDAIVELLADRLRLRKSEIRLDRGAASTTKTFHLAGISRQSLAERLEGILEQQVARPSRPPEGGTPTKRQR